MSVRIDVLTLFPDAITGYASTSVLGRAADRGVVELFVHDFRDATIDAHRSVDDTPYGGGAGMVLRAEPIIATVEATPDLAHPIIALTPSGRVFTHDVAKELGALGGFTLLCGRYEGFDQRALDLVVDDEISSVTSSWPAGSLRRSASLNRSSDCSPEGSATTTPASMSPSAMVSSSTPSTRSRPRCVAWACPTCSSRVITPASLAGVGPRPCAVRWRDEAT